jgi:hypothetical protein
MRRFVVPLLAMVLAGIGATLPTAQAAACSCAMSTPEQALGFADAAFVGTVVGSREVEVAVAGFDPTPGVVYTFNVEGSAKAVTEASIDVVSTGDSAMCGTAFAVQQRYLVFATIVDGRLDTGLCSGNVERAATAPAPIPVTPIAAAPAPDPAGPPLPVLGLGGLAVALLIGSVLAFGRPRCLS